MKKYIVLLILTDLCSTAFAELTREQAWAIGLTGIMTERNNSYRNSLNADAMTEQNKVRWLEMLKRDWSVTTREALLQTLEDTEHNGHAASLKYIQQIIQEVIKTNQDFSIISIYNKYRLTARQYNYLKFIIANWNIFSNRTILAWDLGRTISLCRWAYQTGFLTEAEAWEKILYYARKIQLFYNSWEDYGYDYYMGRIFWASGSGEDITYLAETDTIYKKLTGSFGYWKHFEWYTKLTGTDSNDAIPIENKIYAPPDDRDGKLRFYSNDAQRYNKFFSHFIDNPNPSVSVYQAKVKKISGNEDYGFGILFCAGNDADGNMNYYRLFITVKGRYTVQKMQGTAFVSPSPIPWTDSAFIKEGHGVYNHIKVVRTDNDGIAAFKIYFNNQEAAAFDDPEPLNGSRLGFVASINIAERELFPHVPAEVRFDY